MVVMYVNTSAEVKAETDYCCTSSNAVRWSSTSGPSTAPSTEILFGPDMWLGAFVERESGLLEDPERRARFHIWDGECHVHAGIRPDDIDVDARRAPGGRVPDPSRVRLLDPGDGVRRLRRHRSSEGVHMLSTAGMLDHVEKHPDGEYIVATENGMLYPLAAGGSAGGPDRGQPDGLLQVHEDDHAAEAARLPARPDARGQGPARRSPSAPRCRSSAWSRSASRCGARWRSRSFSRRAQRSSCGCGGCGEARQGAPACAWPRSPASTCRRSSARRRGRATSPS